MGLLHFATLGSAVSAKCLAAHTDNVPPALYG